MTPFYPEGGGQVGDVGSITGERESIEIIDTKKENSLIIHISEKLPEDIKQEFIAKVHKEKRDSSSRNHTATHLLHECLREELGNHVEQKGSLVCPDYLRFDFTHFSKLTEEQINSIENKVNTKIKENLLLNVHSNIPLRDAEKMGAIMLFGEKYEDTVRAIQFDSSIELCGGTHVSSTSEILMFKIKNESSTAAGIRRIEAITADAVFKYYASLEEDFHQITSVVKNKDIVKGVWDLSAENKKLSRKIEGYKSLEATIITSELLNKKHLINSIDVIAEKVNVDTSVMKDISFQFKKSESNLVMMLVSEEDSKVVITIMITDDLVEKGINAVELIRDVSKEVHGAGGGQAFFATAGGSKPSGVPSAIQKLKQLI